MQLDSFENCRLYPVCLQTAIGSISFPSSLSFFKPLESRFVTDLLVSVRTESELRQAISMGVSIIDLKEPKLGALAPVTPELWSRSVQVCREYDTFCIDRDSDPPTKQTMRLDPTLDLPDTSPRLSAALGERSDYSTIIDKLPPAFRFAKIGPSGITSPSELIEVFRDAKDRLPQTTELVAVAYADFIPAGCLCPESVFNVAAQIGLQRVLIDTFFKDGRSTLDHLSMSQLKELSQFAIAGSMEWSLAGSIKYSMIEKLEAAGIQPNCFAVRGDVCESGRTSGLSEQRLKLWCERLLCPVKASQ